MFREMIPATVNPPEARHLKSQIYKYLASKSKPECPQLTEHARERLLSASTLRPSAPGV